MSCKDGAGLHDRKECKATTWTDEAAVVLEEYFCASVAHLGGSGGGVARLLIPVRGVRVAENVLRPGEWKGGNEGA